MSSSTSYGKGKRRTNNYRGPKTRRRVGRYRSPSKAIKSYKGLKQINKRRENIALPNVELKSKSVFQDQQWVTFSSGTWSHIEDLHTLAIGSTSETRESDKVRFLPKSIKIRLRQPQNTEFDYRIMLIKSFEKLTTPLTPTKILNNTVYWEFCTYKKMGQRSVGEAGFKVLSDKIIRFSTNNGNQSTKWVKFKLPTSNTVYDIDDTSGGTKTNGLYLCFITDATSTSANHTVSYNFNYQYLDQ